MRKKGNFDEWAEQPDGAAVEAEVTDDGYDKPENDPVRVKIKEEAPPPAAEVSPSTKAEMEAGAKAIADAEESKRLAREAEAKANKP